MFGLKGNSVAMVAAIGGMGPAAKTAGGEWVGVGGSWWRQFPRGERVTVSVES